jgi:hypothetical protein
MIEFKLPSLGADMDEGKLLRWNVVPGQRVNKGDVIAVVNHDEKHGHSYVMSTGIAHIFTAFMISPFAKPDMDWSFSELRTLVVIILFIYGLLLVVLGIIKLFPDFLAEFFGDPGHALVPSMMAVLYVEDAVPFDWTTFFIIAVPVLVISMIKLYRRFMK